MSDKRELALTVEEYRDGVVPSYQTTIMKLMGANPTSIRTHSFNVDKVITKSNLLDARSVIPSMFSSEMSEVNHAKFYPVGDTFAAVGMYLGFRVSHLSSGNLQSDHNAIIRELSIGWDRSALAGEFGNKGLLDSYANDPFRIAKTSKALPAATDTNFATCAKAVKDLGITLKQDVDNTTASDSLSILVFGNSLQSYLATGNTGTDIATLYDYLRKGFGTKHVDIIEVPSLALKGSSLENANGLTVVSNGTLEMDTVGYPDLDKVGTDDNESGDFDWSRFAVGSVQIKTNIQGGIINQPVTIS